MKKLIRINIYRVKVWFIIKCECKMFIYDIWISEGDVYRKVLWYFEVEDDKEDEEEGLLL